MIISITDDQDPDKIADSGQCFSWYKTDEKTWRILAEHYPAGYPYERYSPYNGI